MNMTGQVGRAAGRVLKQHPELEAKYLDWKRYEVKENNRSV